MNVNHKGHIGQLKVSLTLAQNGYHVFVPMNDYCPIDLIAISPNGKTIRLQVKYRTKHTNGSYIVKLASVVQGKIIPIDRSLIDGWAVYCAEIDKILFVPISRVEQIRSTLVFREQHESFEIPDFMK